MDHLTQQHSAGSEGGTKKIIIFLTWLQQLVLAAVWGDKVIFIGSSVLVAVNDGLCDVLISVD